MSYVRRGTTKHVMNVRSGPPPTPKPNKMHRNVDTSVRCTEIADIGLRSARARPGGGAGRRAIDKIQCSPLLSASSLRRCSRARIAWWCQLGLVCKHDHVRPTLLVCKHVRPVLWLRLLSITQHHRLACGV